MTSTVATAAPDLAGQVTGYVEHEASGRVGAFAFHVADQRWDWSAEVAEMHGYCAVPMRPTTEQVLAHLHPDDSRRFDVCRDVLRRDHTTFIARHRIVDTNGRVRHVTVAGSPLRDATGEIVGTHGFYVDGTPVEDVVQDRLTVALTTVATDRAVIEQAKGMLGLVYGIDADTAFDVLRWRSQATNTKLRLIAGQLIVDFRAVNTHPLPPQSTYDRLVLTVHERVT